MKHLDDLEKKIGNTAVVELKAFYDERTNNRFYAKLEMQNLTGSVKDRPAYFMLKNAIEKGLINDQTIIVEPTSGNTGIALARLAKELGLPIIITMPESMSQERRDLITKEGGFLDLTPANEGMSGAIKRAYELQGIKPNVFIPMQFENPQNALAHYHTTAPEIEAQLPNVDIVVAGIGTGGTITGIGKYFKGKEKNILLVGVEPYNSRVLEGLPPGPHRIQGIGAGFVPKILDLSVVDEVVSVTDDAAIMTAKDLLKREKISAGVSSGAALAGAMKYLEAHQLTNKNILVIFPDDASKYQTMGLGE
ncbi:MAG: cysteine synthase family protein [Erysipelotrichaceae bacterium]|jgi:cysteine synthase A|nr:cysteine synthase family protein [Erysipelotrichaceae bacterium]